MADNDGKSSGPSIEDILKKLKSMPKPLNPRGGNLGVTQGIPTVGMPNLPKPLVPEEKKEWAPPGVKLLGAYTPPKERKGPDFTTEDVIKLLKEEGVPITGKYKAQTGTEYVYFGAPGNVKNKGPEGNFTIRIPDKDNPHSGSVYSEAGAIGARAIEQAGKKGKNVDTKDAKIRFIDTTGFGKDKDTTLNAAGEPYNNLEALREAVRWRAGTALVEPGKEPRILNRDKGFAPQKVTTDPNQISMIDALLAEKSGTQKPDNIVGGNPQNYFSSNQLSQKQNLLSPKDINQPYVDGLSIPSNYNPPQIGFKEAWQQRQFEEQHLKLTEILKAMKLSMPQNENQ